MRLSLTKISAAVLMLTPLLSSSVHAEPRVRANNAAYFQDEELVKAQSHKVDSLAYGEALYLMYSDEDLKALVRLTQASLDHQISVYPTLLQASIASKQGLNQLAMQALDNVKTQDNTEADLDRLYFFQAELAYEQKDFPALAEHIVQIRNPMALEDPDAYYYLRIQSALHQDLITGATDMMGRMAISPWKAISHSNIALWYYRQGQFQEGIDTLKSVLEELDETSTMDAYEYWYTKGRRSSSILGAEEFENQKYELKILSEKVLSLIGYGYTKLMTEESMVLGSDQYNQALESAQEHIFQIPQDSIYATQGLELLAQTLMQVRDSLAQGKQTEKKVQKQMANESQLKSILDRLIQPESPVLTRLRSYFGLLKLDEANPKVHQAEQAKLVTIIEQELAARQDILSKPDSYFARLVQPFYSLDQLGYEYGFSLENLRVEDYPVHKSTLIRWLSQPSTKQYLKTLRFLREGLAFTQEWQAKKELFNLYNDTLLEKRQTQERLESAQIAYDNLQQKAENLKDMIQTEQVTSSKMASMITAIDDSIAELESIAASSNQDKVWAEKHANQLKLYKGQLIWKDTIDELGRQQKAKILLSQAQITLVSIQEHIETIKTTEPAAPIDRAKVLDLDQRIQSLDGRVKTALTDNKTLFIGSFKKLIEMEQQHLQAALVTLRLQQAVSIQKSGEPNE